MANSILWSLPSLVYSPQQLFKWWGVKLVTAPAEEPVLTSQVHAQCRIDVPDEDVLLDAFITAARMHCENITGRRFITQTWDLFLNCFPVGGRISIPFPPLQEVTYVKYTDINETQNTVDPSTYVANDGGEPGEVVLRFGQIWPPDPLSPSRPVNVRFTCGYGAASAVPAPITQAMLLLIGHWYENREAVITGRSVTSNVIEMTVTDLLAPYKMYGYAPNPQWGV